MIQHDATCYLSPVTCHLYLRSAGSCTYYPYLRRYPILQILYMTYDTDPPPAEIMKAVKRIDHRLKNILIQSADTTYYDFTEFATGDAESTSLVWLRAS